MLRERVPFGENVGLLDRDEELFIVAWTVWTIVRRNEAGQQGGFMDVKGESSGEARTTDKREEVER